MIPLLLLFVTLALGTLYAKRFYNGALILLFFAALILTHEALYLFKLVPMMHWWIPIDDAYVKGINSYHWIAYALISAAIIASSVIYARSKERAVPSAVSDNVFKANALPIIYVIIFLVAQQIFGYLSDYWLFQEIDSGRYLRYGIDLSKNGLKSFTDFWMIAPGGHHLSHTDLPTIPLIWGIAAAALRPLLGSLTYNVTNHMVLPAFYLLSLAGTYLVARELKNKTVGIYAAVLLAFIPYYAYLGYLYLVDVPLTAFVTFSIYFFMKSVKNESAPAALASGLLFVAAVFTKYIGLYLVWIIPVYFLLFRKKGQWRPIIYFGIAIAACSAAILIILYAMYGGETLKLISKYIFRMKYILGQHIYTERTEYISHYYGGVVPASFYFHYFTAYLSFGFVGLALVGFLRWIKEGSQERKKIIFLCIWPLSLMVFFSFSLTKTDRFIFSVYPAVAILAAYGYTALREISGERRTAHLVLLLVLTEMLSKHMSFYYCQVAYEWIIGQKFGL